MPAGASPSIRTCGRWFGESGGVARKIGRIPDGRGAGELGCGDHGHGLGVAEDVRQLALAVQDIDRNEDHAQLEAGEIQIDHLEAVGQVNAEPVAGFQPALREQLRQAIAARVDIAERVGLALEFKRDVVAAALE